MHTYTVVEHASHSCSMQVEHIFDVSKCFVCILLKCYLSRYHGNHAISAVLHLQCYACCYVVIIFLPAMSHSLYMHCTRYHTTVYILYIEARSNRGRGSNRSRGSADQFLNRGRVPKRGQVCRNLCARPLDRHVCPP